MFLKSEQYLIELEATCSTSSSTLNTSPLYQLVKLINTLKTDKSDTILEKLATQNCSYSGFSYHIVNRYLNAYDPNCKLKHCFVCIRI